jgi:hypothetical protein
MSPCPFPESPGNPGTSLPRQVQPTSLVAGFPSAGEKVWPTLDGAGRLLLF